MHARCPCAEDIRALLSPRLGAVCACGACSKARCASSARECTQPCFRGDSTAAISLLLGIKVASCITNLEPAPARPGEPVAFVVARSGVKTAWSGLPTSENRPAFRTSGERMEIDLLRLMRWFWTSSCGQMPSMFRGIL
eukprot:2410534-Prymnesium_polylepis.1